jgi:hypothetical protein
MHETEVAIKPSELIMEEAASILRVALTSWQALIENAEGPESLIHPVPAVLEHLRSSCRSISAKPSRRDEDGLENVFVLKTPAASRSRPPTPPDLSFATKLGSGWFLREQPIHDEYENL